MNQAEAKRMVCSWLAMKIVELQTGGWGDLTDEDTGRVLVATEDLRKEMERRSAGGWPGSDDE